MPPQIHSDYGVGHNGKQLAFVLHHPSSSLTLVQKGLNTELHQFKN